MELPYDGRPPAAMIGSAPDVAAAVKCDETGGRWMPPCEEVEPALGQPPPVRGGAGERPDVPGCWEAPPAEDSSLREDVIGGDKIMVWKTAFVDFVLWIVVNVS